MISLESLNSTQRESTQGLKARRRFSGFGKYLVMKLERNEDFSLSR